MYTRQEASRIRQAFWTSFGQYMAPHPSATGRKVSWVNYKTGYKDLYFRLDTDRERAYIGIVLNQRDADLRELFFEQFLELRSPLHALLEEEWAWDSRALDGEGRPFAHIFNTLDGADIFRQGDWPTIIGFLKPRILALDEFWSLAEPQFHPLKSM